MRDFHSLTIASVTPEINGAATSVVFDVPPDLKQAFTWTAGQHVTLRFLQDGIEHRRPYTISNPPDAPLRITAKRVSGGTVSNHIGDALQAGAQVDVMAPFGGFTLSPGETSRRTHYFFATGSGITPIYAMIRDVLDHEPHSVAHLVYGNSDLDSTLFREELEDLSQSFSSRFTLRHVLSAPSMWRWKSPWRRGRLDADCVAAAISETPPVAQDVQYWICGPGSMNTDIGNALTAMDVPSDRIHTESFGGSNSPPSLARGVEAVARITVDGSSHEVAVSKGETLLAAARRAEIDIPFSCQSGVCGACKARLTDGNVHMAARMALDDKDIADAQILTCQSVPLDPRIAIRIEE